MDLYGRIRRVCTFRGKSNHDHMLGSANHQEKMFDTAHSRRIVAATLDYVYLLGIRKRSRISVDGN